MTLQLKNIGMIKEASVKIDGLTVIAGENDTGKSTVGKALFAIIKSIQKQEEKDTLRQKLYKKEEEQALVDTLNFSVSIFWENLFKVKKLYGEVNLIKGDGNYKYSTDHDEFINYSSEYSMIHDFEHIDIIMIETPLVWNFTDFFRDTAQIESQFRLELDYPYLMKDLNFKLHIKNASDGLDIKKKMTDLMGGEFKKDEMGRYYFDKKGQRIELVNTATGIKYFGLFQVLSQNNYLNEETVLILDEPEVHLHPKWQLEMAKIIVELVKNGVKIVVNSHSPYMIEALELYAEKAEVSRNFYLAKKEDDYSTFLDVSDNLEAIYSQLAEAIETLEVQSLDNFKW